MNKKGLVFDEAIFIVKLILFFAIVGFILFTASEIANINIGDYVVKGISSIWTNSSSAVTNTTQSNSGNWSWFW